MSLIENDIDCKLTIDETVKVAGVSRGSFYTYFESVEELLHELSHELSDEMVQDILPMYGVLLEPWQRISVGYRLFMVRAFMDPAWATFVTRHEAWGRNTLVSNYVSRDIQEGVSKGIFNVMSIPAGTDFLMGASARAVDCIRRGVQLPGLYMETQVQMIIGSMGCPREVCELASEFSLTYLKLWAKGDLVGKPSKPNWAKNIHSSLGKAFLRFGDSSDC
ncbi:TetR/AcrR family transcriptional regulator [Pseudomonas sp. D8002]|uniref:TetR/AcrR family transcriptional regulator n=1 Tax=unclassified Pseudomonas TaxID=196821 RepID=UPI00159FC49E|nr:MULTISPECIES: TetR/AcrR family transcriptional regulator [unclassified Pseudomonas]NWA91484.1 TetR/AcrR family transcriptional regulator [Pseudomonas sp. D8002]NWB21057.1 TetR/AcrR family transcriptional regulator [Pseudomonas sp. D4002]